MTPLRQRFLEDMRLRGLSPTTQDMYVRAVRKLAEYYHKSPDTVNEAELRAFLLHLQDAGYARSSITVVLCGLRFFYRHTLGESFPVLDLVRMPKNKRLPVVLSRGEVTQILGCLHGPHYRVCLSTIYSCGLRIGEGARLQVSHIDSERMQLHIVQGKGGKDRRVPLPAQTLAALRTHWLRHRHPVYLFPKREKGATIPGTTAPMSTTGVHKAFKKALARSGVTKSASVHTLRHSWATHLMEAGVNMRLIQVWLGHSSLKTTAIYTHLTQQTEAAAQSALDEMVAGLL